MAAPCSRERSARRCFWDTQSPPGATARRHLLCTYSSTKVIWRQLEKTLMLGKMEGHLRPLEEVEWEKDNSKETLKRIPESYERPKEFLLPVIVHSICNRPEEEPMDTLVTKCQEITGIPPIVVLTKARSPNSGTTNPAAMKRRFADLGVVHSIALENYTENEQNRNQDADNQFLNFLDVCMKEAERGINLRQSQDYRQIFAKNVADQVKEEQELKNKQQDDSMRKLQENKGCCVQ